MNILYNYMADCNCTFSNTPENVIHTYTNYTEKRTKVVTNS